MSSAEPTQPFDAHAAAQQMLGAQAVQPPATGTLLPAQSGTTPALPGLRGSALMPHSLSDRGNARLFVQLYRDQFRHVEGLGWFGWDGYRWKRTGGEKAALWAAGEMAEDLADADPSG